MNVNVGVSEWDAAMDLIMRMLPILIPLVIIGAVLMIVGIISVVKKPNPWGEKIIWLLIIIFFDVIGPVIYFALGSGMLDEKWAKEQDQREQMRGNDCPPHSNHPGGMS